MFRAFSRSLPLPPPRRCPPPAAGCLRISRSACAGCLHRARRRLADALGARVRVVAPTGFRLPGAALADEVVRATRAQLVAVDGLWGQLLPMTTLFFCMAFVNTLLDAVKAREFSHADKYQRLAPNSARTPHATARR
jgi:hypothetical protein